MNKKTTKAIVLKRVDYADSDRILTVLTPDEGKLSLIAKGVKKMKSKLAGGIELFSVFDAGYISGRGDLGQLTSARLDEYYGNIINDINRVQLGYQILKSFDKSIEDQAESEYFYLLCQLLRLLNESDIPLSKIELYFKSKMLALAGHSPNLVTDEDNNSLVEGDKYNFNVLSMTLTPSSSGKLTSKHIKILRLLFDPTNGDAIFRLKASGNEDDDIIPLIDAMFMSYVSI